MNHDRLAIHSRQTAVRCGSAAMVLARSALACASAAPSTVTGNTWTQRRPTSSGDQAAAAPGSTRSTTCTWLLITA
jgi:hypothetical protein